MTTQAPPSYRQVPTTTADRKGPRYANIILGAWLFLSAFLWPHYDAAFTNTWLVGLLITAFAVGALRVPALRWVNAALSAWIVLTTFFAWPATAGTAWNNLIVGALVMIMSFVGPPERRLAEPGTRRY